MKFMMRRSLIMGLLAAAMLLVGASCAGNAPEKSTAPVSENKSAPENAPTPVQTPVPEGSTPAEPDPEEKRVLVACFSATGNTRLLAETIAEIQNAVLYEIKPETPYTPDDLNYNTDCRANQEQNDDAARPAIAGSVEDMDTYDVVFIGYPIWWGQAPKIIYTFIEGQNWAGKTVIPFCTSGSSPYSDSGIRDLVGSDTAWITGRRFAAETSRESIAEWLETLDLNGGR